MRNLVWWLVWWLVAGAPLYAQSRPTFPAGVHEYVVEGVYEGTPMAPWRTTLEVRDSSVGAATGRLVRHVTMRAETGAVFTASALVRQDPDRAVAAEWQNGGRIPNECRLRVSADTIDGVVRLGGILNTEIRPTPVAVHGNALPDFAVGPVLATHALADGDTIRFTVFRCLPDWKNAAIVILPFTGVVRSDRAPRSPGGVDEPVWVVEGSTDYHLVATIAKSDRQLLAVSIPQGTVGIQTERYRETRK